MKNSGWEAVFRPRAWRRLAAVLLLAGFPAWGLAQGAGKSGEIEFGYVEQPPRTFTNAQGLPDGQLIALMNVLMLKAGLRWRAVSYPATRLFENLKDGTTQFSILVRVPDLEKHCVWSKMDLGGTDIRVYSIGNKPPIKSRADLAGKNVIALRGYTYGGLINFLTDEKNNINLSYAVSNADSFDMLAAGRADYLVQYAEASDRVLAAKPLPHARYSVIGRITRHLVISKTYPNAEKEMARLEAIIRNMNVHSFLKSPAK